MELSHLSAFVKARIDMLPTRFTLHGEPVSSFDISEPTGLLPLVVMQAVENIRNLNEDKALASDAVVPADPSTHMLSSKVSELPDMPSGMIHLHLNTAILVLGHDPCKGLELPRDLSDVSLLPVSELSGHIARFPQLVVSHMASPEIASTFEPS